MCYIAGEGQGWISRRFEAWSEYHQKTPTDFHVLTRPVHFMRPDEVASLAHDLKSIRPTLVVIDTLAKAMPGANENSVEHMGLYLDNCDRLRDESGCTVLTIHHTGRDEKGKERGSYSLRAGVDMVLKAEQAGDGLLKVTAEKLKDWIAFTPIHLELVQCGRSAVLDLPDHEAASERLTKNDMACLEALVRGCAEGDDGFTTSLWATMAALPTGSFYDSRRRLVDGGYVTNNKKRNLPTMSGYSAVEL